MIKTMVKNIEQYEIILYCGNKNVYNHPQTWLIHIKDLIENMYIEQDWI